MSSCVFPLIQSKTNTLTDSKTAIKPNRYSVQCNNYNPNLYELVDLCCIVTGLTAAIHYPKCSTNNDHTTHHSRPRLSTPSHNIP